MPSLTKRVIDAAKSRDERYFVWCSALPGFGVRIYPSDRKVFVAQIRVGRRQRRVTIGTFGAFTVDQARERAKTIIQAAADGRDPQRDKQEARQAITVAELCEEYLQAARSGARHDPVRVSEAVWNGGNRRGADRASYRADARQYPG